MTATLQPEGAAVEPGCEAVAEEFARNFTDRGELGAAFALYRGGRLVVDLWGGVADSRTGRPWGRDTLQIIFSGSKGIVVTALLLLVEREQLRLDDAVARYWPEFAAAGKHGITIRQVATFTAAMPALRVSVSQDDILDARAMAALLAAQEPESDPRAHGLMYGPFTSGWIIGELVRRVDGRPLDAFFRQEIARPHGLDLHFGVPDRDLARVARTEYGTEFLAQFSGFFANADPLTRRVWSNPMPFPPHEDLWSARERLQALIPAVNVAGTARDFARLYGMLAEDAMRAPGERPHLLSRPVLDDARGVHVRATDPLIDVPMSYGGGGYRLRTQPRPGPDGVSFGHDGGGGSANQAWPRVGAGVSYVMNRLIALGPDDRRASSLLSAAASALTVHD
ncbi:CubicO group peptidase (beta-lactamase class C family) [Kineococcus xinjiangensis]|uniref:CubicO group peptidase (Beta-lactamase class C family) n=1 Tax=Kineococcus xinjiangensis TaxID=512762 RepID=A0A2S6IVG8_9ACTN|nr:CubicO group peptidase (beta-lactamase class C family) [Kineococcus xinjiangensis]